MPIANPYVYKQGSLDLKERVSSEVAEAVNFLDSRDQFWTQID